MKIDRYKKLKQLGDGGMGAVWEARDTQLDRLVALKILRKDVIDNYDARARFLREMRLAVQIESPYILPIYDFSNQPPYYIAMRLVQRRDPRCADQGVRSGIPGAGARPRPGCSLADELRDGPMEPARIVPIVHQVAAALDAAHRSNLRHRDVKPSNVLLDEGYVEGSDHAYLIDWGIAHRVDTSGDTRITRAGSLVGSIPYIAPERQTAHGDPRSDIFSLAVVLYEALTGQLPFGRLGYDARDQGTSAPHPMSAKVPEALQRVVLKGLDPNPERRFQTAREFGEAAHRALQPVTAPSNVMTGWLATPAGSRTGEVVIPVAAGVSGIAAGVFAAVQGWLDPLPWTAAIIGPAAAGVAWLASSRRRADPPPGPEDATRT